MLSRLLRAITAAQHTRTVHIMTGDSYARVNATSIFGGNNKTKAADRQQYKLAGG